MTKEECDAITDIQFDIGKLGSLMGLLAESFDEGRHVDAVEACADMAKTIARRMDQIPDYTAAQVRR